MYCQRIFYYLHKFFSGGPTCIEYLLSSSKFSSSVVLHTVLAVQLFDKIKWKKKKMKKNLKKMFLCISHMLCQNTFIFGEFIIF